MKLNEFLQDIALGDLSGSTLTDVNGGYTILPEHLPKVLQALNQALQYFHAVFPLKQSEITIELLEGVSRYYLDSDHAMSALDSKGAKYLRDTVHQPFEDDVLSIEEVFGDGVESITLNDPHSYNTVFTPEYNCIQVTDTVINRFSYLQVMYRATMPRIPLDTPATSRMTINLPSSFNSALQAYVASLVYMYAGGESNISQGNIYFAKYKSLVEELQQQGIGYKPITTGVNIKPMKGGFL